MPEQDPIANECRRRSGRLVQESLTCNLGHVVDLSKGGMRVRTKQLPGQGLHPVNFDGLRMPWQLRAELSWSRLVNDEYEVGFRFLDVSEQQAAWLMEIAMRCSFCRQLPDL